MEAGLWFTIWRQQKWNSGSLQTMIKMTLLRKIIIDKYMYGDILKRRLNMLARPGELQRLSCLVTQPQITIDYDFVEEGCHIAIAT